MVANAGPTDAHGRSSRPPGGLGKLLAMIALLAILATGGFFGGGFLVSDTPEGAAELGDIVPLGEFLVNLGGTSTFLQTKISVHVAKGHELAVHGDETQAVVPYRDAVNLVLFKLGSHCLHMLMKFLVRVLPVIMLRRRHLFLHFMFFLLLFLNSMFPVMIVTV